MLLVVSNGQCAGAKTITMLQHAKLQGLVGQFRRPRACSASASYSTEF